jgi:hypothetical protein
MNNDILCPECGHSMAFHGWYGGCECPINGVNKRCRCTQTHYSQYSILRKQLEDVKDVALRVLNKLNEFDYTESGITWEIKSAITEINQIGGMNE